MKEMYNNIVERINIKKKELGKRQNNFSIMCHNEMQSPCFEQNAINYLIVMQQLKSEIEELEYWEILTRAQIDK